MESKYRSLFSSTIWRRGEDYYRSGNIKDYRIKDGIHSAIVEGSRDYRVIAKFVREKLVHLHCDCPYANDGKRCKHMAALLIKIANSNEETVSTVSVQEGFLERFQNLKNRHLNNTQENRLYQECGQYLDFLNDAMNNKPNEAVVEIEKCCDFLNDIYFNNLSHYYKLYEKCGDVLKVIRDTAIWEVRSKNWIEKNLIETNNIAFFQMCSSVYSSNTTKDNVTAMLAFLEKINHPDKIACWLKELIALMRKLKYSVEQIGEKVKMYPLLQQDFQTLLKYYENVKDYPSCITLLKGQFKTSIKDYSHFRYCLARLEEFALKCNDRDAFQVFIENKVKNEYIEMNYIDSFKGMFSKDEWEQSKETIFEKWKQEMSSNDYMIILSHYKEYRYIFELLIEQQDFYLLVSNIKLLLECDVDTTIHLYMKLMMKAVKQAKTRHEYETICDSMRYLKEIEDYGNIQDEIIYELKQQFSNRHSLIEILNYIESREEDFDNVY